MAETQFCPPNKHEYNTPTDPKHDRLHDRSCILALADNGSGGEVTAAQPATEPLASTPRKRRAYSEGGTNAALKCAKCKEQ